MMMFAILFGLSMDYEVFLMSRIREEYLHNGRDNGAAVADGLAATARVITAAALIMIAVFVSFVASPNAGVKNFGLGMAVAIFVDATVIRMVILPATMELLGRANWWLPRWLRRLPEVQLDMADQPALQDAAQWSAVRRERKLYLIGSMLRLWPKPLKPPRPAVARSHFPALRMRSYAEAAGSRPPDLSGA
jgi:hypothetical protein